MTELTKSPEFPQDQLDEINNIKENIKKFGNEY